jgi:hypothetical protein
MSDRELHIYPEGTGEELTKYRLEVWETFVGKRRLVRKFWTHVHQLERMKLRYMHQFRVFKDNVVVHREDGDGKEEKGVDGGGSEPPEHRPKVLVRRA